MNIFLAGATGAIGRRLVALLKGAGHHVVGTTRSPVRAEELRMLGVEPVVVDVFDRQALSRAAASAEPEVVIHELTDLPKGLEPSLMCEAIVRNARIREEATRNLVGAAVLAGARRLIAQSIAWAYADGPEPHLEDDPLDVQAGGSRGVTVRGVVALEDCTLKSAPLEGVVLRYGQLYGPGTHADTPSASMPLHVDAAAYAAALAVDRGAPGPYNVAQPNGHVSVEKARTKLGWDPNFRIRPAPRKDST
jgi:nucleoside-diphosphate-sugar epimerase